MADDLGIPGAVTAIGLAMFAAHNIYGFGTAAAVPTSTVITQQVGLQLTMSRMVVRDVAADEGFWIDSDHGRVWVQIATNSESPYTVREGDVVTFTGDVVAHNAQFPAQVGVTGSEGAAELAAQGAHVTIPVGGLVFNS